MCEKILKVFKWPHLDHTLISLNSGVAFESGTPERVGQDIYHVYKFSHFRLDWTAEIQATQLDSLRGAARENKLELRLA